MKVFTVHVRAADGDLVLCDSIQVCSDRLAVMRALGNILADPMERMFADPDRAPGFELFWQGMMDRISAYEGAERAMVSNQFGRLRYMVAVEQKEVLE